MTERLLLDVIGALAELPHALIGAAALGVHGVARSTSDLDLLVADRGALDAARWMPLRAAGCAVDLRLGDAWDPLVGVVRVRRGKSTPIDVVVAGAWVSPILARAGKLAPVTLGGASIPVVAAADLVILKLYAGGPLDLHDVEALLAVDPATEALVVAGLASVPEGCREAWEHVLRVRRA